MLTRLKQIMAYRVKKDLPSILHHHIPKTAGTSFNTFLQTNFNDEDVLPKRGLQQLRSKDEHYQLAFARYRLIHVHSNLLQEVPDDWFVVTFFAIPPSSCCLFNQGLARLEDADLAELPLANKNIKIMARTAQVSELLNQDNHLIRQHLHNGMCRSLLSRLMPQKKIESLNKDDMADAAFQVLKTHMNFVGNTNEFKTSMNAFGMALGLKKIKIPALNKTDASQKIHQLSKDDLDCINEYNQADEMLYQLVVKNIQMRGYNPKEWH